MAEPENKRSAYNLIAAFADMAAAQNALEGLRSAGIGGTNISLLGRQGPEVVSDERQTRDSVIAGSTVKGTLAGAVGGGLLGGMGGFLVGLAALAVPGVGPVISAGVWGAAALGAIAGANSGAFIGYITGAELSQERSEAYETHLAKGRVLVGVHIDDHEQFERAFNTLVRFQPLDIDRFGTGVQMII